MFADATSIQEDDPEPADDAAVRMIVASRFCIPPTAIDVQGCDGSWVDFTVGFAFEAGSLAEVRVEAERIMRMCGRDVEVFSVTDESDSVVLTEDDL